MFFIDAVDHKPLYREFETDKGRIILAVKACFFLTDFQRPIFSQRAKEEQRTKKDIKFHLEAMLIKYKGSDLFL
jgi:hypothetical protein